ncbi:MAG TPA: SDR family oxidoreductase [Spirochaetales bacterium]|nr:SDR family oxidoreductase [Spirochaetales bacterium]
MKLRRFTGQVVLITGSANGIGKVTALRFAEEGAHIACIDIDDKANQDTAEKCHKFDIETLVIHSDVTEADEAGQTVKEVLAKWGRIDTLVCSAGLYEGAPIVEVEFEDWQKIIDINLTGTFLYNKAVVPVMIKQRSGSIVNISSMAGKTSWEASSQYSASKSGVIGLTRSVAMDLAPYGVTANAICPGNTLTDMVKGVAAKVGARYGMTGQEWLDMRANDCPMKRLAQPWEMAGVIAFLASKDSRYLTGQSIEVDGGMVLS